MTTVPPDVRRQLWRVLALGYGEGYLDMLKTAPNIETQQAYANITDRQGLRPLQRLLARRGSISPERRKRLDDVIAATDALSDIKLHEIYPSTEVTFLVPRLQAGKIVSFSSTRPRRARDTGGPV